MALSYPDNLKHQNSNYPLLSASDLTVQGYFHVADLAARDSIPILKRLVGSLCVVGIDLYKYNHASLDDVDWQLASNWSGVGGSDGLPELTNLANRLSTDANQYINVTKTQKAMTKITKRTHE
jgi:hypothetical protein